MIPTEAPSDPLYARTQLQGSQDIGAILTKKNKPHSASNSHLGFLPGNLQTWFLGWVGNLALSAGADCTFGKKKTLKISLMPAPSPRCLPRAHVQLCPHCSACCGEGCRNAVSRSAAFPSDLQGEVGSRWKELFVSVSIFNLVASSWELVLRRKVVFSSNVSPRSLGTSWRNP